MSPKSCAEQAIRVNKLRTDLSHWTSPDPKSTQFPMALATSDKGSPRVRMVGHADLLVRAIKRLGHDAGLMHDLDSG